MSNDGMVKDTHKKGISFSKIFVWHGGRSIPSGDMAGVAVARSGKPSTPRRHHELRGLSLREGDKACMVPLKGPGASPGNDFEYGGMLRTPLRGVQGTEEHRRA